MTTPDPAAKDPNGRARVEEALRESENRYRLLFQNMLEGFAYCRMLFDEQGRPEDFVYLDVNGAFEVLTGLREVVGRRASEVIPGLREYHPELLETYGRVARTGQPERFEVHFRPLELWLSVSVYSPQEGCFVAVFDNTTERKQAEETLRQSEQRLRALADSMPQLAWTAQPDGYITWYNRRWYEYTGTTPQQMEGWGWQSVHDPATLPDVLRRWRESIATGTAFDMEFPLRGADGRFRRFLTRVFPLKDARGDVVQWFGTNTDVTELVEAQEALRDSDRRKSEFLAVLSHELRNPLAPIRNSIYLLDRAPPGSAQAAHAREVIQRQTEHLTRLVDDLLDVTRISRGKIDLQRERIDVREVVRRTCDDHRSLFESCEVALRLDVPAGPVWVDADATRLSQAISNLLQNAAKFTPAHGSVHVGVESDDARAVIRVRDSGVGMDEGLVSRLFQPFVQADRSLARTQGGLGLGLALVKGLAELHGGSVAATSDGPGRGSTFVIELPLARSPAPAVPGAPGGPATSARRVLIVEDNVDAGNTLGEILELDGHRVRVARDGRSGIAMAREWKPDVVLCDIGLPDLDGHEVARTLRADETLRGTRLVALSGYAQVEDKLQAKAAGFDAHLSKPPPLDELKELLT